MKLKDLSSGGVSWNKLLEQGWDPADSAKYPKWILWYIGQRGFEFCVFKLDVLDYLSIPSKDGYTNFMALNLHNWTKRLWTHEYRSWNNCFQWGWVNKGY